MRKCAPLIIAPVYSCEVRSIIALLKNMANSRSVSAPRVVSIEDLRPLAERRLPRAVFDYLDGGADGEETLAENCNAFKEVLFRPHQAVTVPSCDMRDRKSTRLNSSHIPLSRMP